MATAVLYDGTKLAVLLLNGANGINLHGCDSTPGIDMLHVLLNLSYRCPRSVRMSVCYSDVLGLSVCLSVIHTDSTGQMSVCIYS